MELSQSPLLCASVEKSDKMSSSNDPKLNHASQRVHKRKMTPSLLPLPHPRCPFFCYMSSNIIHAKLRRLPLQIRMRSRLLHLVPRAAAPRLRWDAALLVAKYTHTQSAVMYLDFNPWCQTPVTPNSKKNSISGLPPKHSVLALC